MDKAEEAIQKLVALAEAGPYHCLIKAHVDFFPISKSEYIEIDDVDGDKLFVELFCEIFPEEMDGFPVRLSEALKNKLEDDLPSFDVMTN